MGEKEIEGKEANGCPSEAHRQDASLDPFNRCPDSATHTNIYEAGWGTVKPAKKKTTESSSQLQQKPQRDYRRAEPTRRVRESMAMKSNKSKK